MKRLTLLRHAKSGWDEPVARDFDRPINARGQRAARVMGRHMRDAGMTFDRIVASPAVRVVETLERAWEGYGSTPTVGFDKRIYLASAVTLLDVVHEVDDSADTLLMSGHNPGMEDMVLMLVPDRGGDALRDAVEEKFPTAAIAVLEFDVDRWADVKPREGRIVLFVRPRDIDPTLGPDAAT